MIFNINRKKWIIIVVIASITALIPILITAFELITTEKESVIFLEGYPTSISTLFLLYYLFIIILGVSWFIKQIISLIKLKNEKAKTELLHLKSQVNPHFFFNTLNNLYGLVGTDVKKAQKLILKLSETMRYSIYEGERDFVTLKEEVDYLNNYIELHKMRYHKEIDIQFEVQIEDEYNVMPLLYIILLENAFKHGLENLHEDAYIHLKMKTKKNEVFFEIENNFDISQPKENNGIGLKNLKRRLELVYPQKHTLTFSTIENVYKAQLTLQL
ncbi:sensor histidine kinase [Flavivirga spongiicola]|uniref:Histidine kinase n=1 Tax=Flavivirga spongiicola TaxID=421621 RepID=A0ABU7XLI1_9FLAO|nr:histidine kinase [Flavivirga sp. MEBiC05379]MDO5981267.1 histidine kinase [Flavivirga sp. MEBiC05379]